MSTAQDLHPQFVTDETGKKTAVIWPIEEYRLLLEDFEDLSTIIQRRGEATISHSELVANLSNDGLL